MAVMLTCVLMWLGRRVAARAICLTLDLALDIVRTLIISPTTSAIGRHLGFEHDYYSYTAFRGVLRHRAPSSYGARVKFGEHLRSVKVREAIAESIFSFLSALQTSQLHHNSIVHS